MPIPVYHMSFHRAAGKAINFVNDSHSRYWFHYADRVCVFPRLKFYDKIFLSHNTELLFVKEVIFVCGCSRTLRGKIPRLHCTFKKYINLKSKAFLSE